ncbi:MAG: hypothetical protein M3N47_14310 [Chloroflexota bacterium]|nr:hypothetical protein [Chloroflexota bacterium]
MEHCGARTKSTGLPCEKAVEPGRSRCRMHGGATPRGIASPHTRHGRYSKDLPTQMLARYQVALDDPELLSVRDDAALLEARIREKLADLAGRSALPDWRDATERAERLAENLHAWDAARIEHEVRDLVRLLTQRRNDAAAFHEVRSLMDQKARLARQEHKRLIDLQQMIPVERAMLLIQRLSAVINDVLADDPDARRAIVASFREAMMAGER